jgi:hypothetical protein
LFKGARPNIVSAPKTSGLGQTFSVTADTSTIASVVLVAPSAVTHGNDMHQALIKLQSQTNGVNTTVTVPSSRSLVPTGYYMLFIVDSTGRPSVAKFIHIA